MKKRATIGIVILNYNDYKTTIQLVDSIIEYEYIDKIVVVDNCSQDNSYQYLMQLSSAKVDVIKTEKNGGYSYGNNFGAYWLIDNYHIEILFIANPDVRFSKNYIIKISDTLSKNRFQLVTGIATDMYGCSEKKKSRLNTYYDDLLDCTVLVKRLFPDLRENLYENSGLVPCTFVHGSLFGIRADVFKKIEGFDEGVFLYGEERILSTKISRCGYKMAIDTDIKFLHMHSVSINKSLDYCRQLKCLYLSRLYYYDKYFELSKTKYRFLRLFMWYGVNVRKLYYLILPFLIRYKVSYK